MAKKFLVAIDLAKNELQNAAVQSLASAPGTPVKFQLYGNSSDNTLYWWDGAQWIAAKAAAGATPAATVTTQAVGDSPVVGVSTNFAREDHKHGREAFANPTATTTFGLGAVNGSAATIARSDHTHGTPTHDAAAHSAISRSALAAPTADLSMGGFKLTSLGTPLSGSDATTKDYVDNLAAGLSWKDSVRVASTGTLGLSGLVAVDGVTVAVGDRVLVKNQTSTFANGIWVAASGVWARSTDTNTAAELVGAAVFVEEGTVHADQAWVMTTNAPITLDTTPITWVQFGAGTVITAGAGLTGTTTFDVVGDASITVTADQISRAALTGDVTATAGANATTIAANAVTTAKILDANVTNAKLANVATATIKGRASGGTGPPEDMDGTQARLIMAATSYYWTGTVGGATSQVITHNLATRNVVVNVYRTTTPWDTIECDVERTTTNTITLRFAVAPSANEYTVVVIG